MVEFSRGGRKDIFQINLKGDIYLEGGGSIVDSFRGIWKILRNDGVLGVGYLVYADSIWILNDAQVEIGEFWTFLGGYR